MRTMLANKREAQECGANYYSPIKALLTLLSFTHFAQDVSILERTRTIRQILSAS